MNEIIVILSEPLVALSFTQFVGLIFLLTGLNSDEDISALSGTYWGYNSHMLNDLIHKNYDQLTGILTIIFPTLLQASEGMPFWTSYLCLLLGLILRFSPIRPIYTKYRFKRITAQINERGQK